MNINWQKYFDWAGLGGLVITLALLPLDRFPYIHHIPFSLGFISLVLLLLGTASQLLQVLLARRLRDFRVYILVGILLALPVAGYAISTTYAIDHAFALSATKALLAVALRAYCFFILLAERPNWWPIVKKTIYWTTAAVVSFGFFQYIFDTFGASQHITDLRNCCTSNSTYVFPRVHSTALEPLYLDHYLMIPLWLLSFDFWKDKKTRRNKWLVALFLGTAVLFILTIARSATISLIIAAMVFYFGARFTKNFQEFLRFMAKRWILALLVSLLLVAISGIASLFITKSSIHGAHSGVGSVGLFGSHAVSIDDGSARTRYDLWPKSITYFKEKPLQGVGAYNSRIRLHMSDYQNGVSPARLQPFNNDLLGLLVDLGLLGVVTFGPLMVALIIIVYRQYRLGWTAKAAGLTLALVGMLLQSNFFHSILLTRLWVVIGLILTLVISPTHNKKSAR